jgi:hypothetical protein
LFGRSDEEQLAFAASQGRTILSFNVGHFNRLHGEYLRSGREHAGIILGQQQRDRFGEYLARLLALLAALSAEDMVNHREFLSGWEPAE